MGRVKHGSGGHAEVGCGQHFAQGEHVHTTGSQTRRVQINVHRTARAANGLHLTHAGRGLQFRLHRVGNGLQFRRWQAVFAPKGDGNHRHIINALGFDNRRQGAQFTWHPILVGIEHVVKTNQRFRAGHPHLELNGQYGQSRPGHGVGVLDACNLTQHLLGGLGHHVLHVGTAGSRKRNQHIGHGDVDLRLFFPRRHHDGKKPQQQGHQGQQRR